MQRFLHDPVENLRSGGVRERCFHHLSKRFNELRTAANSYVRRR